MILEVPLGGDAVELARAMAARAALGGASRVRGADRAGALFEDQLAGQLGQVALHTYWFGDLTRYTLGRYLQNRTPWLGDGGEDIPAANVDVKTSVMRRSLDPLQYNLCVRPRERHAGWVYVLALVSAAAVAPLTAPTARPGPVTVVLAGWAGDAALPADPQATGPLVGAHVLPARLLKPLPPIRYQYLPEVSDGR